MSDFCQQCSLETFGKDCGDLAGLTKPEAWAEDLANVVICEGCGITQVDPEGRCIATDCLKKHAFFETLLEIDRKEPIP